MASPAALVRGSRVGIAYIPAGASQAYFAERKIAGIDDMKRDYAEDYSDGETATHEIPGTAIEELRVFETSATPAEAVDILREFVKFLKGADLADDDSMVYIVEPLLGEPLDGAPVKKRKKASD